MSILSDQEVIALSRSLKHGVEAQREAMAEARKRGIFNAVEHLKQSPVGQAFFK